MLAPRPSRRRRTGTTSAYTTGGVERTRVAPAASPPTPSTSSGQALAKNARMGHHSVGVVQCKDGPPANPLDTIVRGTDLWTVPSVPVFVPQFFFPML